MKPSPSLFYITQTSTLLTLLIAQPTTAQIIPDNTVNTTVTPNGNINVIEGGTRAGTNLFHSFQEFSVPTGREAFFNNAFDIRNIFSRVTGKLPSNIDGLIRANGVANLFLLNPNGIIFGQNARLNIGGSFLATTANSFKFADGSEFSATNLQVAPLLSINVPIGLQMGSNPGNITVNGTGLNRSVSIEGETTEQAAARLIAFEQDFLNNPQGLQVQTGKTIALVGGNLTFQGGIVGVRQGRIELGSVNSGEVNLNPTETGFVLGYENISNFGEIQMSQSSAVAASGEGAGEIRVRGGKITLNEISSIGANTIGNENGKGVTVKAEQLSLFGGSFLTSGTFSSGDAGNLIVKATESVEVSGISTENKFSSSLQTVSLAGGKAGNLTIDTGRLILQEGAFISTRTSSKGEGGNLTVRASQEVKVSGTSANGKFITLLSSGSNGSGNSGDLRIETGKLIIQNGAELSSFTSGEGKAGNLFINAREEVEVSGTSADGNFRSVLSTQTNSAGNAGDMTIETERLIVRDGAFISTQTLSKGEGGNLSVQASQEVQVTGISPNGENITLISSSSTGSGNAGELRIETGKLIIQDGAGVTSFSSGDGKAGNLFVNASEEVQVSGTSPDGNFSSVLSTQTSSAGNAGDMTIETGRLIIKDGAFVSTETRGTGNGGNLLVQARDSVEVLGTMPNGLSTTLSAGVGTGKGSRGSGGNLTIETGTLSIRDGGNVSTATSGQGNAGNLLVKARELVEVVGEGPVTPQLPGLSSSLDSDVSSSGVGNGGNLTIETQRLSIRDGGKVSASVFGQGKGGSIQIKASEQVEVVGAGRIIESEDGDGIRLSSHIDTSVFGNGVGSGGDINIDTQVLSLRDGGGISANNSGKGNTGNVRIQANKLVEVVGVANQGLNSRISTTMRGVGNGGDISINTKQLSLRDGGEVSAGVSGQGKGGSIQIKASEQVEVVGAGRIRKFEDNESFRFSSSIDTSLSVNGIGSGGDINIDTQVLSLRDGGGISASTQGVGDAGNVRIQANELVEVVGTDSQNLPSIISTRMSGVGRGGDITINTKLLSLRDDGLLSTGTFGVRDSGGVGDSGNIYIRATEAVELIGKSADPELSFGSSLTASVFGAKGNGGSITVETKRLTLTGSNINTFTLGDGNAGNILLRVSEAVELNNNSRILANTNEQATGNGGEITIKTGRLQLANQSYIGNSSFGQGQGGTLTVRASESVEINNSFLSTGTSGTGNGGDLIVETGQLIVRDNAQISAGTQGTGNAGNISIKTKQLTVSDGLIESSTLDAGNGGILNINARSLIVRDGARIFVATAGTGKAGDLKVTAEIVELTGKSKDGLFSGLFASTEGAGNGGNLIINAGRLIVRDGASLSAGSFDAGAAGNIEVTANSILIDNGGLVRATSTAGSQGNINLQSSSLIMRRGSEISTNAKGKATGGNIIINTDVLAALENSDISANAEDSFGGRVIINAQGIFGTKFRPENTPQSDITATSKLGPQFSGTVEINTPIVDPSSGLVNLPDNAVDVSRLVPKGCVARRKETGTFYITGNGGFQYRPGDGLVSPLPTGEVRFIPEDNSSSKSQVNEQIIEAQGIYKLESGEMVLGWECPE